MSRFCTVTNGAYEYEIKRSVFLAFCRRVRSEAEAAEQLGELRKKYRDCTHICYAFVTCDAARSSDDGEPAGTAGAPIAEAIRAAGVCETLIAVVRYFGGVKLGAGGLTRAYMHAAAKALAAAGRAEAADCFLYKVRYPYAVWKKIEKKPLQSLYKIVTLEYNETVELTYAVLERDAFTAELNALTQGACTAEYLGERRVERMNDA